MAGTLCFAMMDDVDQLWEILAVITVVVLAGIALLVGLVRGRGGKAKDLPPTTPPPSAREAKQRTTNTYKQRTSGSVIDTSKGADAPPRPRIDTSKPGVGSTAAPAAPSPTSTPAPAAPPQDRAGAIDSGTVDSGATSPAISSDTTPPDTISPDTISSDTAAPIDDRVEPAAAVDRPAPLPAQPVDDTELAERPDTVVEMPPPPTLERPESARGRMTKLRSRLAKSNSSMGRGLLGILSSGELDEAVWEEVEDTLLGADLGVEATTELVDNLKTKVKVEGSASPELLEQWLHDELYRLVDPTMDRRIAASRVGDRPAVVMVVGVNGTGKTTTVGKLARVLVAEDKEVLLGAADTFRAAAADQLETWGARVGVATVRSDKEGADPAAVAFDAVKDGQDEEADVVIIDTAGRLHNKVGLMDELAKVKRVIEKRSPIDECLLVLDATTGQNGMRQAEVFAKAVDVTGVVLTKLDGTAKGGIVVLVQRELGVPVKLVGLGEGPDDLAPFDPKAFVEAVLD